MSQKIRIKLKSFDHALVDKSADKIVKTGSRGQVRGQDRENGEGYRCCREWSYTSSYRQEDIHRQPFDLRQQEVPRAVRA